MGHSTGDMRREMLEAFLAIEEQDAHVKSRREAKSFEQLPKVAMSVAARRRMANATGIPETLAAPRHKPTTRQIDNPMLTDGLAYSERRNTYLKVTVEENAMERIGALVFIRRRLSHHEQAAERFKTLYEARYGSGNPAMDPSRVQVDTSPIAHDCAMTAKIDRTWRIEQAEKSIENGGIGKEAFDRIVACVVLGIKCEDGVQTLPSGKANYRHVKRETEALIAALDSLAILWGYRSAAA